MTSTDFTTIPAPETAAALQLGDWSPDDLRIRVAQEEELRAIIVEYCRSQMIENKHYYILQAGQKPALSKEGALNLCSLFKVRVAAADPHEHHHDDGHYSVRYRITLINMQTGTGVADGDGYCSTRESKYAYRWLTAKQIPPGVDITTLPTRTTRYGGQVRLPTPDLADHYNTVLKMACKRAIVAAALCLPLVSELFTQDRAEPRSQGQNPNSPLPPTGQPQPAPPVPQIVSVQAVKALWSQIKQHVVDVEAFRAYLAAIGAPSSKEMTPEQLDQCLKEIDTRQGQAFQLHDVMEPDAEPPAQETRAQLFKALGILHAVITEAKANQPPGEPHAQSLLDLAEWRPKVARACENPETPENQLQNYLTEVEESLDHLQQLALTGAAT